MILGYDYVDLFVSSNAMIHDCSTFTAEYLATGHPVMFMGDGCKEDSLNQFGVDCFKLHYRGNSIADVEDFIENVVLNGCDNLLDKRLDFVNNVLLNKKKKFEDVVFEDMKQTFCYK